MIRKSGLKSVIGLCVLCVMCLLYIQKYNILYHYYMWRLNTTSEGALILELNESIERIGPEVVPLLIKTYKDERASGKKRHAATLGLVKGDKRKARSLFTEYLKNGNADQVSESIYGLYKLKDTKAYKDIVALADSPDSFVRKNVALYLGLISTDESKNILMRLANDEDSYVKYCADSSLKKINQVMK